MRKSTLRARLDAILNVGVTAFGVAVGLQLLLLPLVGVPVRLDQSLRVGAVCALVWLVRSLLLRRLFAAGPGRQG